MFRQELIKMNTGTLTAFFGLVILQLTKVMAEEECMPTFVECYCESNFERFIQVPVNTSAEKDEQTGLTSCTADTFAPDVCSKRNCVIVPNENLKVLFGKEVPDGFSGDKSLLKKKFSKKYLPGSAKELTSKQKRSLGQMMTALTAPYYPQEIIITPGGGNWKRNKRSSGACEIPELLNSEITCWKWPNWVTCNQECIYGHGIEMDRETITKTSMNCRYTENKWKPHKIQDCKPYVNCKAHLVSPGDLSCVSQTKEPSYCEIKCEEYDDLAATPEMKYTCDRDLQLPHCATLDQSVSLINPPAGK